MSRTPSASLRARRRRDILACAPGFVRQHRGFDANGQIARFLGLNTTGLRAHVSNEAELIRLLCHIHLNAVFEAVCATPGGPPSRLTAMAQAVLATAEAHSARHRIYLLHRFVLPAQTQRSLEALRATIDNSFLSALHALAPEKPFCALRGPARALVCHLLHLPLWQRTAPPGIVTEWLACQISLAESPLAA